MPFDDIRAALVALLSQPDAALASLLLVPPLTILLPLYVVLARWPSQRIGQSPMRLRTARSKAGQRPVQRLRFTGPVRGAFNVHRPLRLDSNGQPRYRIPLPPPTPPEWPARDFLREAQERNLIP